MKLCLDYKVKNIDQHSYLLPIGQALADSCPSMQLNEAGTLLWEKMVSLADDYGNLPEAEELLPVLSDTLQEAFTEDFLSPEEMRTDISLFWDRLRAQGILREEISLSQRFPSVLLKIGSIFISVHGDPGVLEPSFLDFRTKEEPSEETGQHWYFYPTVARPRSIGKRIYQNAYVSIYDCDKHYVFEFMQNRYLQGCSLSKDGVTCQYFGNLNETEDSRKELTYGARHLFLYKAAQHGFFCLHSVSLCYRDRLWLFSATSGTGKSTHASHWEKLYGISQVNGDVNLLKEENGQILVYGSPWCGSSDIYTTKTYPLGGIVFLKRDQYDHAEELPHTKGVLSLLHRFVSPNWTEPQLDALIAFSSVVADKVPVLRLGCTKEASSACVMKAYIDRLLQS